MKRPAAAFLSLFGCLLLAMTTSCQKEEEKPDPQSTSPSPSGSGDYVVVAPGNPPPVQQTEKNTGDLPRTGGISTTAPAPPILPQPPPKPQLTPQQQSQVVNGIMRNMRDQQAKGLGSGGLTVNGAWEYKGYSYLAPNPDAPIPVRLVAVDATIAGHTVHFDLDDIEIIDGLSQVSYASDPHVTLLTAKGEPAPPDTSLPKAPSATRVLLIYAFPRDTPSFKLYYWGNDLLGKPYPIAETGWGLPYPKESE